MIMSVSGFIASLHGDGSISIVFGFNIFIFYFCLSSFFFMEHVC